MYRPRPMTVRSTMVSTPAFLRFLRRSTASATRCSSLPQSSGKFSLISVLRTNTCSCMSVQPSWLVSIGPRTVSIWLILGLLFLFEVLVVYLLHLASENDHEDPPDSVVGALLSLIHI